MLKLISEQNLARLLSLSPVKKIAFLVLLYDRMNPELRLFYQTEGLDSSIFQNAREEFWRFLREGNSHISWVQLRENILNKAPDTEEFGTLMASFALNAALVAADIAGFIADGQNSHMIEAVGYARGSLDAHAIHEMGSIVYDRTLEDYVEAHPFIRRERRVEEEDLAFLSAMQDAPWPENILSMLQHRAEAQHSLLNDA